jgi:ribosomal protein S18 acetylase RimI-like enzyme
MIPIRPAERSDIPALAELFLQASCGIVEAIYDGLTEGQPVAAVVAARLDVETTTRSYRRFRVAVHEGAVVGMLQAFAADEAADDPAAPALPAERRRLVEPLWALHAAAAGTYHVNAMAVRPEHRGRGIGTALLAAAGRDARAAGLDVISLVVFEANGRAVRLYRSLGFIEAARSPAPRHPLVRLTGDLLLMAAPA